MLCRVIINLLNRSRPNENNRLLLIMSNDIRKEGEARTSGRIERARTRWGRVAWREDGNVGGKRQEAETDGLLHTENCSL